LADSGVSSGETVFQVKLYDDSIGSDVLAFSLVVTPGGSAIERGASASPLRI
jgi:hypothetical protein